MVGSRFPKWLMPSTSYNHKIKISLEATGLIWSWWIGPKDYAVGGLSTFKQAPLKDINATMVGPRPNQFSASFNLHPI